MTSKRSLPSLLAAALSAAAFALCLHGARPATATEIPVGPQLVATHVVIAQPGPEILAMSISDLTFKPGEVVTGHVRTSSDVTSVEIRVGLWGMSLTHASRGYFEGSGKIPHLPFFLKGNWTMHVVAKSADGQKTVRDVKIRLL